MIKRAATPPARQAYAALLPSAVTMHRHSLDRLVCRTSSSSSSSSSSSMIFPNRVCGDDDDVRGMVADVVPPFMTTTSWASPSTRGRLVHRRRRPFVTYGGEGRSGAYDDGGVGGGGGGMGGDDRDETAPFDSNVKRLHRARAAESCRKYNNRYLEWKRGDDDVVDRAVGRGRTRPVLPYDYLHVEVARRLVDRLDDIRHRPEGFPLALELGARGDVLYDAIVDSSMDDDYYYPENYDPNDNDDDDDDVGVRAGRGGVRRLVRMDSCMPMLRRDEAFASPDLSSSSSSSSSSSAACETFELMSDAIDGKSPLPFPDNTFDLVISSMMLHWVNDLPKLLCEIERILRPDGCLLFAFPGGNTLPELRSSLVLSELERTGGVSTHVGPYVDPSHVGGLLTGAGLRLPTIDVDDVRVGYPDAMVLMEHLGRMGEGNACSARRDRVGLGTFLGAACLYGELYPVGEDEEGDGIIASAQVIYGIAWKEHESQQRPDDRGSATRKLTDISVTTTTSGGRGERGDLAMDVHGAVFSL
ncbi:hypothetical protein ACHAXA_005275 [Cyclostephanos tholiformis]|uniref:Methyltransferase type 11 domain-containing protein n=1 Tax=Cyclostephanos tholiformis TaxID=382380 RepID=A0ABD3RA13_9STRA